MKTLRGLLTRLEQRTGRDRVAAICMAHCSTLRRRSVEKSLRGWRCWTNDARRAKRAAEGVNDMVLKARQRQERAVITWWRCMKAREGAIGATVKGAEEHTQRKMATTFVKWRQATTMAKDAKSGAGGSKRCLRERRLLRAWSQWRIWAEAVQRQRRWSEETTNEPGMTSTVNPIRDPTSPMRTPTEQLERLATMIQGHRATCEQQEEHRNPAYSPEQDDDLQEELGTVCHPTSIGEMPREYSISTPMGRTGKPARMSTGGSSRQTRSHTMRTKQQGDDRGDGDAQEGGGKRQQRNCA